MHSHASFCARLSVVRGMPPGYVCMDICINVCNVEAVGLKNIARDHERGNGRVSFVEWWTRLHSAHSKAGRITRRQRFSPFLYLSLFLLRFKSPYLLLFLLLPSDPFQPFFQEVALSLVGFCPTAVAWQHAMQGFARDQPATGDFRLISFVRSTRTHRIPLPD